MLRTKKQEENTKDVLGVSGFFEEEKTKRKDLSKKKKRKHPSKPEE